MSNERGLTLVEVSIAMAVLATAAMGIAASMMTGLASNRVYQNNTLVVARCQHHLETMYNLQFGVDTDPTATAADLDLVFSGDPELGQNPPTLISMAKAIDVMADDTYEFTPPNLGFPGTLLVTINNNVRSTITYDSEIDGDGDGIPDDGASLIQGSVTPQDPALGCYRPSDALDDGGELFAVEIFFRAATPGATPQLVLRGFRAQDP